MVRARLHVLLLALLCSARVSTVAAAVDESDTDDREEGGQPDFSRMRIVKREAEGAEAEGAYGVQVAFVVYYSSRPVKIGEEEGPKLDTGGTTAPEWADFDSEQKANEMLKLAFHSARHTHPGCRLVVLTNEATAFEDLNPTRGSERTGPKVEIVRFAGVVSAEEMMSRQKARALFLREEARRGDLHHMVLMDSDILITRSLSSLFHQEFEQHAYDVAGTWRQDREMPINGGILYVQNSRLREASAFFEAMLRLTLRAQAPLQRWFGTSDQVALKKVTSVEYGYDQLVPGTESGRKGILAETRILSTFYEDAIPLLPGENSTGLAAYWRRVRALRAGQAAFTVLLLPAWEFNSMPEQRWPHVPGQKQMMRRCVYYQACCSKGSRVLHFKGKFKRRMPAYKDTLECGNGDPFQRGDDLPPGGGMQGKTKWGKGKIKGNKIEFGKG